MHPIVLRTDELEGRAFGNAFKQSTTLDSQHFGVVVGGAALVMGGTCQAGGIEGLVSFADDGAALPSPRLSNKSRKALGVDHVPPLHGLRDAHRDNLAAHRARHGF